jgi:hypothetical protein
MDNNVPHERLLVQLASLESYPYVQVLTDQLANPNALGALLEFVSRPFVRTILEKWSQDSSHAKLLRELADFSATHADVVAQVYTFKSSSRANKKFSVEDEYIGALLATRAWPSNLAPLTIDDKLIDGNQFNEWIEKLKIFVLVQSMVAAEQKYVKERGISDLAKFIRVCVENIDTERATLLYRICMGGASFPVFLGNLQYITHTRSDTNRYTNSPLNQKFLLSLSKVLGQNWISYWKEDADNNLSTKHNALIQSIQSSRAARIASIPVRSLSLEIEQSDDYSKSVGDQDGQGINDDGTAGPDKPFVVGQKAIFQKLEMSLMLPFSWHRPMEHERVALEQALNAAQSGNPTFRLGSAMTQLAILLSRNLRAITLIPLTNHVGADWSLDINHGRLVRSPPRLAEGWKPSVAAEDWIHKMANRWIINLQDQLASVLKEAHRRHSKCATLGSLWEKVGQGIAIDDWFRQFLTTDEALDRISTAMLAEIFPTQLHLSNTDQASVALIASSPRTTLPAKCGYFSKSAHQVQRAIDDAAHSVAFAIHGDTEDLSTSELNAGGSRLFADLTKVNKELRRISGPLKCTSTGLAPDEWVSLHNLYTTTLALSLLASTGSRPVNSPFESIDDFDFNKGFVFISDKYGGRGHNDRICLIGTKPLGWLRDGYLQRVTSFKETKKH